MNQPTPTGAPNAINNISLCMSGGGYRSTAFQLGTMSYLHRMKLLEKVSLISTVSGGTFAGATYALSLAEGTPFDSYFTTLKNKMRTVNLLKMGLANLADNAPARHGRNNNLINSMALVYDREYCGGKKFGALVQSNTHLQNIIFNATEFYRGLPFAFISSKNTNAYGGNFYLQMPAGLLGNVHVGDMVASSSCFPGGFEPLKFPQDYLPPGSPDIGAIEQHQPEEESRKALKNGVGIMDGGVDDNQGIINAHMIHEKSKTYPDMMIISDVGGKFMTPFTFPPKTKLSGFKKLSLQSLNILLIILCIVMGLTALAAFFAVAAQWFGGPQVLNGWADYLTYIVAPLIICVNLFLLLKLRSVIKNDVLKNIPILGEKSWSYLKKITVGTFADMMAQRVASVMTMVSDVFLKQIRRLLFGEIYNDYRYKNSRVSNLIYTLTASSVVARDNDPDYAFMLDSMRKPSPAIMAMAQSAASMATTLWFEESELEKPKTPQNKPDSLICCGQVTMCYNLLLFILRNYGTDPAKYPAAIASLYNTAVKDWENFQAAPYQFADGCPVA